MEVQRNQGKTLQYLTLEPEGYDSRETYPVVILLHGFGANMGDLAGLCPTLDADGYVYVCPNAPTPVEVGFGSIGYAWTPIGDQRTPADVERAADMLDTLFREVTETYRVPEGGAVLGGFSQGGMMTYMSGLANPALFRGIVALSSSVREPEMLRKRLPAERGQPIFISHGTRDPMIPIEEGRKSLEFLTSEGYSPEYHEYVMGHEINQDVLGDLAPWLHRVLPPFGTSPQLSGPEN